MSASRRRVLSPVNAVGALALLALVGTSARAQSGEPAVNRGDRRLAYSVAADPSLTSTQPTLTPTWILEASADSKAAVANIGWAWDTIGLSFKLRAPIDEESATVDLAALDGLSNQATADVALSYVHWNPHPAGVLDVGREQKALCEEYHKLLKNVRVPVAGKTIILEEGKTIIVEEKKAPAGPSSKGASGELCTYQEMRATARLESISPQTRRRILDLSRRFLSGHVLPPPVFFTVHYKAGRLGFDYVDPTTLEDESVARTSQSWTAAVAVLTARNYLLGLSYRAERAYQGQDEVSLCTPISGTTATECRSTAIGAPDRNDKRVLEAEVRKYFSSGLAVNPKGAYDVKSDVWTVQAPIYFLRNEKARLVGGVTPGWRSDTSEFTLTMFIGQAFEIIPQ